MAKTKSSADMETVSLSSVDTLSISKEESSLTKIAARLGSEDILLDLDVSSRSQLFEEIDRYMVQEHAMSKGFIALSLTNRERVGSTGLGNGVAVLHAHVRNLDQIPLAYVRLKSPIAFDAPDRKPVSDVLVLLDPNHACQNLP